MIGWMLPATIAEHIDWFNQRRLHGELGHIPPAEYETLHNATLPHNQPSKSPNPPSTKFGT